MYKKRLLLLLLFFLSIGLQSSFSQCLQVLDGNGVFTDTPEFVSCTPGIFTVFIQPDRNMGNYTIVWGDGSPNSTGASLLTTATEMHAYAAMTANYTISITDNSTGCTIMGLVVLERNPLASIQLPAGDDNFGCTPVQFRFINSSTQISTNTTFTWDFGDGSPTETYDFMNLGDTVLHIYLPGVGVQSCELNVTLTATNFCGSSTASFFPLRVWDLDEAQITPSASLLCYPDTVVQYTNNTIRNCFPEGNQSQRYERWNFGNYWGLGRDSIIEWRAWNPPIIAPPPIAYPGIGTYFVTLQDSSFCGLDDITISIQITDAPTAVLTATKDTICEGESVTFINSSFGGANRYRWNYDLGSGFQNGGGGNKTRTYNTTGDYTIRLAVRINGAQGCVDTADVDLHVLPSPSANFSFDNNNLCDSMDVTFTNTSSGAIVSYNWNFGNGNTFIGLNPPIQPYLAPSTYNVSLVVANMRGCSDTEMKTVRVRETPVSNFTVNSVCLNIPATFTDLSTSGGDPITSYNWAFGDGATSTQQDPTHLYTAFGTYTVRQIVSNGFCNDTSELMVTVENRPTADFVSTPKQGCSRLTVNFTNQSSANATSYRWNFGDGSSPVFARDTFHTYSNSGDFDTTFVVQMIAFTAFGCSDTTLDTISVFPIPTPSYTSDAVVDCGPVTVN
ncbi:MAG: PKD domain-containing protein, partial [Flavobacteriales bacterium]|nr:PKD domain-containing protein [Flavobacteriales bacterium]